MTTYALTPGKQSARVLLCLFEACSRRLEFNDFGLVAVESHRQTKRSGIRTQGPWWSGGRSVCRFGIGYSWLARSVDPDVSDTGREGGGRRGDVDIQSSFATWAQPCYPLRCAHASCWPWHPVEDHQIMARMVSGVQVSARIWVAGERG